MNSFEKEIVDLCNIEMATLVGSYKYAVYGGNTVVAEGIKEIKSYSDGEVCFRLRRGVLKVKGSQLTVCNLCQGFAVVKGNISSCEVQN